MFGGRGRGGLVSWCPRTNQIFRNGIHKFVDGGDRILCLVLVPSLFLSKNIAYKK